MIRHPLILLLGLSFLAGCATTTPQPAAPSVTTVAESAPGSAREASLATMSAIVEKVDLANRLVTLRLSDGEKTTIRVGDEVKNLPQVKKGDEVSVGYMESVAIQVKKPSEGEVGAVAAEEIETAQPGEKPGGAAARTVVVTAKIVDIDRAAQEVTLEGKEGDRVTIDVRDPKHFDAIAVGDLVEITYTEALAISLEPTKGR